LIETCLILGMKERIKETLELRQSGLDEIKFLGEDEKIREIPSLLSDLKSIGDGVSPRKKSCGLTAQIL
jgi:hypothetical protein